MPDAQARDSLLREINEALTAHADTRVLLREMEESNAALRAENEQMRKALVTIERIARVNFGRQAEKLADIEPIARAALSKATGAQT